MGCIFLKVRCCNTMNSNLRRQENISAYLFLLPSLVFFVGFVIYPMAMCIWTSFTDANMNSNTADTFIGLANYVELWQDKVFLKALKNTIIIVLVSVPVVCFFSLLKDQIIITGVFIVIDRALKSRNHREHVAASRHLHDR